MSVIAVISSKPTYVSPGAPAPPQPTSQSTYSNGNTNTNTSSLDRVQQVAPQRRGLDVTA
jgi:hypothetical protein